MDKCIRVLLRPGRSIEEDVKACVERLKQEGVAAREARRREQGRDVLWEEQGCGLIWVEESDLDRALTMLRIAGFEVVGPSRAESFYS